MRRAILDRLLAAKAAKRPVVLVTQLEDGRQLLIDGDQSIGDLPAEAALLEAAARQLRDNRSARLADRPIFIQVFNPPLRLIVVGAVHIAQALVPMARLAGYEVTVIDPRRAWATDARFPDVTLVGEWPDEALRALSPDRRTAVVTLTHDPKLDDPALTEALVRECFYIGALGSTRTHAKRLARLREAGLDEPSLSRIHGPAGLPIGARSPAEIAVSILAQMTAVLHGVSAPNKEQVEAAS